MSTYLLDANVLIALTAREHVHHERVSRWAAGVRRFALCPLVEGALIRFAVRLGVSPAEAQQSLLASLAGSRPGTMLATLDEGLAEARPELTLLLPPQ